MDKILSEINNIHFIGIGGVGMSGLAFLLKDRGFSVSGSDSRESNNVKMLRQQGIDVFTGHKAEHVTSSVQLLVFSSAINQDNPEIIEARLKGICILKRGELLAKLCQDQKTITISGSHGKTTTTSLLSYLLESLGYSPTVFLGGKPLDYSKGARWGSEYFVVETDESDGSFLYHSPWVSVITNIDREHLDYYTTMNNLEKSFLEFARKTKDHVFGWGDQPSVLNIVSEVGGTSFGWKDHNMVQGANFKFDGRFSCFDVCIKGDFVVSVKSPLIGRHNCLNVLAAFSFFAYIGEDLNLVNQALQDFKGTGRRFQIKQEVKGVIFVDDYAHHPTEIKAVLAATRLLSPQRIFIVLQPHRFSRVKLLKDEFVDCLADADEVVVTDIYGASEDEIEGVNAEEICKEVNKIFPAKAKYIPKERLSKDVPCRLRKGDIVLNLGAGDINILADRILDEFKKNKC